MHRWVVLRRVRMKTTVKDENRFESDATRYASYLRSTEGRLRSDLTVANLLDLLPAPPENGSLRALDLGCGTGTASLRLASLGIHITLLDSSPAMLEVAEQTSKTEGLADKITLKQGDAARVADIFQPQLFNIILCHNLLEYVDEPAVLLRAAAGLLHDSSAILSILVRNQAGEVLKAALKTGDLNSAEHNLTAEWGHESLYGGKVRLFTPDILNTMLEHASLTPVARRGVRVISDYLSQLSCRAADYEQICSLERKLGSRQEFFAIARYMHVLVRRITR
jgi:2-polyprenyl-3-methyl-5-hydroxy-6-metoxy-1,4-benzoquinol methylase